MLLKSLMQEMKKAIDEIPNHANFSYICVPKPVGRLDSSRLERVNDTPALEYQPDCEQR